jgi:hypothetical protein
MMLVPVLCDGALAGLLGVKALVMPVLLADLGRQGVAEALYLNILADSSSSGIADPVLRTSPSGGTEGPV